jgi:hypothetical protein
MNDPTSRYHAVAVLTLPVVDPSTGEVREIRYNGRRFIPAESGPLLVEHPVGKGERLDHIAARHLGDPTQYWRIADAAAVIAPEELVRQPGSRVPITLPQPNR